MRNEIKEYEAVAEAAGRFVKSVAAGDSSYAKTLFTEDAVLFGMLDGVLEHGSIEQFYKNVDSVGPVRISRPASMCWLWRKPWPWSGCLRKDGVAG